MSVISISSPKIVEGRSGSAGTVRFVVSLSAAAAQQVTVDYATADSAKAKSPATAGTDYVAKSGTLKFEIGQVEAYIDVSVTGDATVESEEAFDLVLSNVSGATLGKDATLTATATITDDEPVISIAAAKVDEGAAATGGKLRFVVSLSAATPQAVSMSYITADGTKDGATAGSDYTAASGTLTIPVGKREGYIDLPILNDTTVEKDETLSLTLSDPLGASFGKGATLAATGTIMDDEAASGGSGTLSISSTKGYEGEIFYFSVSLSAPTSHVVKVSYDTETGKTDLARGGSDFTKAAGTLTFQPGETVKTVAVSTTDDILWENTETFQLMLSHPSGANFTGGTKTLQAAGTLLDDEPLIAGTAATLHEPVAPADGSTIADNLKFMRFAVSLAAPASHEVTVSYSTAKSKQTNAATSGTDFASTSGKLVFVAGEVTAYAYVKIIDDARAEGSEVFDLVLSQAKGAGFASSAKTLTLVGTILDNEPSLIL